MRYLFLFIGMIGLILTSYGFWVSIDQTNPDKTAFWKPGMLLVGIILMIFGLLLYGVPDFFKVSG